MEACQYVYRYNGDDKTKEVVEDLRGEIAMPVRGQIIQRNGKSWKVVQVSTERVLTPNPPIPIHTISLTDNLKLPL
jgi:hypothetical protein